MSNCRKVGLIACSNALPAEKHGQIKKLENFLRECGLTPIRSRCIFERDGSPFSGTGKERAEELSRFFRDPEMEMIFDVSGGDLANGVLPFLDMDAVRDSRAVFWGYSDLTTMVNAIWTAAGRETVLYQIRNLTAPDGDWQREAFRRLAEEGSRELFQFPCEFLQGESMDGIVVGGNLRCLLKLAGTRFWPDMRGKILLLEAYSGQVPQMATFFAQLKLMGVFEQISGLLLGTFMEMEEKGCRPGIEKLAAEYAGPAIPIARTAKIGHRKDSHAVLVGSRLALESCCR